MGIGGQERAKVRIQEASETKKLGPSTLEEMRRRAVCASTVDHKYFICLAGLSLCFVFIF